MTKLDNLSLWDHLGTPPTTSDAMSRAAAGSITGVAGTLRKAVALYVRDHGPVAEWRIEAALDLAGNTVRPRLWELCNARLVEQAGRSRTPSGRSCHLYAITDLGRAVLAIDE